MANTCDYCHKPLSLMRRLRGEQFCSVEHLDLYTAQQAEFALQRLAASVEDKPIHQRPPALLKRIARTPAQANGSDSSQRSRNGAGGHEVLTEAPPVDYMHLAHETPLAPPPPLAPRTCRSTFYDPYFNRSCKSDQPRTACA